MTEDDAAALAQRTLRAELTRRAVDRAELARRLTEVGSPITEQALNNKISRGGFSAAWFLQVLALIGAKRVDLD